MIVKLNTIPTDFDGKPITYKEFLNEKDENGEEKFEVKNLTVRKIIVDAFMGSHKKDENISGKRKIEMYQLAKRVHKASEAIQFNLDEIKDIKTRCEMMYNHVTYAWLSEYLEECAKVKVE